MIGALRCVVVGHRWIDFRLGTPDGPVLLECSRCRMKIYTASAIEARRAGDGEAGAVGDESATRQGDAQDAPPNTIEEQSNGRS